MGADGVGHGLAAGEAGVDEGLGVGGVKAGAGQAAGGATVAARGEQAAGGFLGGGVGAQHLTGVGVDGAGVAVQAHEFGAAAEGFELLLCRSKSGRLTRWRGSRTAGLATWRRSGVTMAGRAPSVRVRIPGSKQPGEARYWCCSGHGELGPLVGVGCRWGDPAGGRGGSELSERDGGRGRSAARRGGVRRTAGRAPTHFRRRRRSPGLAPTG